MSVFCELADLLNESDVEQKLIYPMLINSNPLGLGYKPSDIRTKSTLKQYKIGKSRQKYYYPDYLITLRGIPLMVIEAKEPDADLEDAFHEARLYAAEVNANFSTKENYCSIIMVCNGTEIWCGYNDQGKPEFTINYEELHTESVKYHELLEFCSKNVLKPIADSAFAKIRGNSKFVTPVSNLGGRKVQDEELVENTYGRTLVFENRSIFDPQTEEDKAKIVKNAYIKSKKREQHVEPIYREIKKIKLPSEVCSTQISTDRPDEITEKLRSRIFEKRIDYSLMLLIGSVGSGKSTFVRYFKEVVLKNNHPDVANRCEWIFVNMNTAPVEKELIYNWMESYIISVIEESNTNINYRAWESIQKIFLDEINEFENGIGQIIKNNVEQYNSELFKLVSELVQDNSRFLQNLLKYIKQYSGKLPIVVLDNCDKRNRDVQLLMFEVAEWLREKYKCIVILPMRENTFDTYKSIPPLDTVVKDLVFRIDPPDLLKVLQERLEYIVRLNKEEADYAVGNGINVHIQPKEQIEYFRSILYSIRNNGFTKKIFYNLSNRNTRSGIQLFEDFCKSGHIKAEEILKIRVSDGEYSVPSYMMANALIRKNRKYYNGNKSNFINLFYSTYNDDFPDPFIRVDILKWLKKNISILGPNKIPGYHKLENLIKDMQVLGHDESVIVRELTYMVNKGLVYSESQREYVELNELVKIAPSGSLHIDMLQNLSYLAACSEDIGYRQDQFTNRIAERISQDNYLEKYPMIANAQDMLSYLVQYRDDYLSRPNVFLENTELEIENLSNSESAIERLINSDSRVSRLIEAFQNHPLNEDVTARVINKNKGSLLGILYDDTRGFLATTHRKYGLSSDEYTSIQIDDYIRCKIIEHDSKHVSVGLSLIKQLDESDSELIEEFENMILSTTSYDDI